MSKINSGGAAFPMPNSQSEGMTLRDYFAAKVLQGFLSNTEVAELFIGAAQNMEQISLAICEKSYEFSDAMILAREAQS